LTELQNNKKLLIKNALAILGIIFVFLFAIDLMGEAFNHLGKGVAESILFATSNPFVGLFIGLLITAIIQSSSTSTSMIVAVVASGSITIADAVPMIMGANIGTTLTSTIVSLGFINKRIEFRRAIAAGVYHDFFNILTVLILFPLEHYYGLVSNLSQDIASLFIQDTPQKLNADYAFKLFDAIPLTDFVIGIIDNSFVLIILSFVLLFGSIKFLSKLISKMLIGESQDKLRKFLFNKTFKSFSWGMLITAAVQSSSITTSLVIPFVATNKIKIKKVAPFILGANIGTTITAFIAVLFKSNAAMSIAITHLLINLIGVIIFLPFPIIRDIPIRLAKAFGTITMKYRLAGFTYIIFTFFIIPFMLIYFNKTTAEIVNLEYEISTTGKPTTTKEVISKISTSERFEPLVENSAGSSSSSIYQVHRRKNILFFNQSFFLINKPGFCWDDEDVEGKYKMCIESIIPQMTLSKGKQIDSVYLYNKTYYNPSSVDSVKYNYLISIPQMILVGREKLAKDSTVISKETLIDYYQQ